MDHQGKHRISAASAIRARIPSANQEKYKELHPERYANDVAHVLETGKTPAGMHRPICVREILDFLQVQPGQVGLDATLGYGGHTQELLKCLEGRGRLYATDVDPIESEKTGRRLAELGYGPEILPSPHEFRTAGPGGREERFGLRSGGPGVSPADITRSGASL